MSVTAGCSMQYSVVTRPAAVVCESSPGQIKGDGRIVT